MPEKKFCVTAENIKPLVEHNGGCIAIDRITVDGRPISFMYREGQHNDAGTGWRFMLGDESDDYMDDPDHHDVYAVNLNDQNESIDGRVAVLKEDLAWAFAVIEEQVGTSRRFSYLLVENNV